jgi:xanthine dehydrogenase YagS FAD-binding subunit
MQPFTYERANDLSSASRAITAGAAPSDVNDRAHFIAGGTNILDLMKLGGVAPGKLVDIRDLEREHSGIEISGGNLRIGSMARMSTTAEHPLVRENYPVIAQSLELAASAQLRNMATLGGNVLQRTRCQYFRDPSWTACNKREPGSGCSALDGVNRKHAILGTSDKCIASYPGDFGTTLAGLGASVEIAGSKGKRVIPFDQLHVDATASDAPAIETTLAPGDIITAFLIPSHAWGKRSLYLKVRDRQSYEFGLATAAVAIDLRDGIVSESRIGLGGVAYKPWRARDAEAAIMVKRLDETSAAEAANVAFSGARPRGENAFKVELGKRTLTRALLAASMMEI